MVRPLSPSDVYLSPKSEFLRGSSVTSLMEICTIIICQIISLIYSVVTVISLVCLLNLKTFIPLLLLFWSCHFLHFLSPTQRLLGLGPGCFNLHLLFSLCGLDRNPMNPAECTSRARPSIHTTEVSAHNSKLQ